MTIAHKTGLAAMATLLLVAALLLPPTAASAEDTVETGALTLVGTAHLSQGIQAPVPDAPGCLGGAAVGAGIGENGDLVAAAGTANAGAQFTYNNTLTDGDAEGTLWIDNALGPDDVNTQFTWERVGVTAVVTLHTNEDGVAVGLLLPVDTVLFECVGDKKSGGDIIHGDKPGPCDGSPGNVPHEDLDCWPNAVHVQIVGVGVITS